MGMMNLNWLIKRKCLLSVMVAFMAFYIQSVFADNYDSRTDLMAVYQISSPGSYELFGEGFDEMKGKINYMWVSNAGYRTPARSMYLSPGIVEVVISFSQPLYSLPQNTFLNINGTRLLLS